MGPFAPIFYSLLQKILMGTLRQKISGKISLIKYEQGYTNTGYLKIGAQNCNFIIYSQTSWILNKENTYVDKS